MSRRRRTWPTPSRTSGVEGRPASGALLDEDPVAEAVEVGDGEAGPDGGAEGRLEAVRELLGRLDVVGQDEDLLGQERAGERVVGVGRGSLGRERKGILAALVPPVAPSSPGAAGPARR